MDNQIPEIEELIKQFSKLPGLGPKSAKRKHDQAFGKIVSKCL